MCTLSPQYTAGLCVESKSLLKAMSRWRLSKLSVCAFIRTWQSTTAGLLSVFSFPNQEEFSSMFNQSTYNSKGNCSN